MSRRKTGRGSVFCVMALAVGLAAWAVTASTASASTVLFTATVNQAQETPPTGSMSVWSGTFTMDTVADTLSITVTDTLAGPLLGPEIAAHIHGFSGPGVPSGIKFGLPAGSPKIAVWNFAPADEPLIIAEMTYVNIHTTVNPGGEIRGQIVRTPTCGDTVLDGGEGCDDGNNTSGDGCSATCTVEVVPNNYLCHQVKDLKVPAKFNGLLLGSANDQTGSFAGCDVKKPKLLCNPASVNGGPIDDVTLHYCCYQVKCPTKVTANYDITDQFGALRLQTKKPKLLCNPCDKALAP